MTGALVNRRHSIFWNLTRALPLGIVLSAAVSIKLIAEIAEKNEQSRAMTSDTSAGGRQEGIWGATEGGMEPTARDSQGKIEGRATYAQPIIAEGCWQAEGRTL